MQFVRKYILLMFLAVFPAALSFAQEEFFDSLLIDQVKVENPVYKPVLGIGVGVFNFFGDVNDNFKNFSAGQPGFRFTISTFMDKKRLWKADFFFLYGSVSGNERTLDQNLNFHSRITSIGGIIHYDFANLINLKKLSVSPYLEAGIGSLQFSAKGDLKDSEGNPYIYAPDGTIRNSSDVIISRDFVYESDLREANLYGEGRYTQFGAIFPVGIGFNAALSKRVSMRVGTTFNFSTSDLIDNVNSKSKGVKTNNRPDFFSFSFISIHLDLFSQPDVITVEKMYADFEVDDILTGDEDGDWVLDFTDQCPNTPFGVEVDSLGCPLDGDNDWVPDYLDKELNTPFPAYVDNEGKQIPDSLLIEMQRPGEAIPRSDLEYYLLMARESDEKIKSRPQGVPLKFKAFDQDQDDYLSFDELLFGITQYFDFRTFLSLEDIYEMMDFYFLQE